MRIFSSSNDYQSRIRLSCCFKISIHQFWNIPIRYLIIFSHLASRVDLNPDSPSIMTPQLWSLFLIEWSEVHLRPNKIAHVTCRLIFLICSKNIWSEFLMYSFSKCKIQYNTYSMICIYFWYFKKNGIHVWFFLFNF